MARRIALFWRCSPLEDRDSRPGPPIHAEGAFLGYINARHDLFVLQAMAPNIVVSSAEKVLPLILCFDDEQVCILEYFLDAEESTWNVTAY